MKNIYPEPSREFHNAVLTTLNNLPEKVEKQHKIKNKTLRIAIVCAIIGALSTTTVFATATIYNTLINPVGKYGVEISPNFSDVSSKKESVDFVKLNLSYLPDGIKAMSNTEGLKYCSVSDNNKSVFSFWFTKVDSNYKISELFVNDYKEVNLGNNEGVILHIKPFENSDEKSNSLIYIYYKEMNVLLTAYVSNDVSDDEIEKVMKGIELTKGNNGDLIVDEAKSEEDKITYDYSFNDENYQVVSKDTSVNGFDFSGNISCNSINILDNISGLNQDCFYLFEYDNDLSQIVDENGNIKPYEKKFFKDGDGINSIGSLEEINIINGKFVKAEVTVTNTTNEEQEFGINTIKLNALEKDSKGNMIYKEENSLSTETHYIESNINREDYYSILIPANSSETITVGFFVNEDVLDDLYLTLNGRSYYNSSDGVYTNYVVKVK